MTEVVFVVKCGKPMSEWFRIFASGDDDPIVYEQALIRNLNVFNPTSAVIKYRYKCKNSLHVYEKFMQSVVVDNQAIGPQVLLRDKWFRPWGLNNTSVLSYVKKIMTAAMADD